MISDRLLQVSTNQDITPAVIIQYSDDVIDLQDLRDLGEGVTMFMRFRVTEAFTNGTGVPNLQIGIAVMEDTANPTALNTIQLVRFSGTGNIESGMISSSLPLNAMFYVPLPSYHDLWAGTPTKKRYMRAGYYQPLATTTSFATGRMDAGLVLNYHTTPERHYPSTFTA